MDGCDKYLIHLFVMKYVSLLFPLAKLCRGDYVTEVSEFRSDSKSFSVTDFQLFLVYCVSDIVYF